MNPQDVLDELRRAADSGDFYRASNELTARWSDAADAFDAVRPALAFMEEHASLEYGTPGPLVHFLETFYGKGYERELVESVRRRPVAHTVWMLHRVINGTKARAERRRLEDVLRAACEHPLADAAARQSARDFLE
jgi:hypothetical protein